MRDSACQATPAFYQFFCWNPWTILVLHCLALPVCPLSGPRKKGKKKRKGTKENSHVLTQGGASCAGRCHVPVKTGAIASFLPPGLLPYRMVWLSCFSNITTLVGLPENCGESFLPFLHSNQVYVLSLLPSRLLVLPFY